MYFVYEKPMYVATPNYDLDTIVEWFIDLDLTEIWEDLKDTDQLNPEQVAKDILGNTDWWSSEFREACEFTEEENEHLTDQELYEQLSESVEPALAKYFKEHWDDMLETYETKDE